MLTSRLVLGYEDKISLYFLMEGYTNNRCDATFGFITKTLKTMDALCPSDMMTAIDGSSISTDFIACGDVQFRDWTSGSTHGQIPR